LKRRNPDHDPALKRVEDLLNGIQIDIADASYRCGAYARALKHFEQHIRLKLITKLDMDKEMDEQTDKEMQCLYRHLQKIYSHMDEPDGMEGISSKFPRPLLLDQQILEDEGTGRWAAAQTGYELALQSNPRNIDLYIGLTNCLKHLGDFGENGFGSFILFAQGYSIPCHRHRNYAGLS
jgi:serine/threonine-protein kinase ATR